MSTNARSAPSIGRFGGGGGGDDPDDPHAGLGDAQRAQLEYEAKRQKRAEWARKLLERRIEDFKASPEGVLLNAAEANDTDALLTALARDPDLEVQTDSSHQYPGYTALHFAAHHGNVEMVLALLMSVIKRAFPQAWPCWTAMWPMRRPPTAPWPWWPILATVVWPCGVCATAR